MEHKEEKKTKSQNTLVEALVDQYHARKEIAELARQGKLFKSR